MQDFTGWGHAPSEPHQHPHCRSGLIIIIAPPTPQQLERMALRYLWRAVIQKGRNYVSLDRMAKDLGLRYDQAETFVTKFHAERKIPRLLVVEEIEG